MSVMQKKIQRKVKWIVRRKAKWCDSNPGKYPLFCGMRKFWKRRFTRELWWKFLHEHRLKNGFETMKAWEAKKWKKNPRLQEMKKTLKDVSYDSSLDLLDKVEQLKEKLDYLKKTTEFDESMKEKLEKLPKTLAKIEKTLEDLSSYDDYDSAKLKWTQSSMGKCLSKRLDLLKIGKTQRDQERMAVKQACNQVKNQNLPFANGGCLDQLEQWFSDIEEDVKGINQQS